MAARRRLFRREGRGRARSGPALIGVGLLLAPPLAAQVPTPAPPPTVGEPQRDAQVGRGVIAPPSEVVTPPSPRTAPPSRAEVDARAALVQPPCPFADSPLTVRLDRVVFAQPAGGPIHPDLAASLAGVVAPAGEQPIRVICDLRDAANSALRRDGWVASIQIPAQEIAAGELRLNVVAARIVRTRVRGAAGPYEAVLRRRIALLEALDPLNERQAERLLLLAGDLPGLNVRLALRPAEGGAPGEVEGELAVEFRRTALLANAQNYNARLLGRETVYARGELYGVSGMGDTLYFGASGSVDVRKQVIVQGGYLSTLDTSGTSFGSRMSYAWSRPDLGELDYRTDTLIAGFDLTGPIVRSVGGNATAGLGFDYVDQTTDIAVGSGVQRLSRDRLRVLYANLGGDYRLTRFDGSTRMLVRGDLEVRQGLDLFGASRPLAEGGAFQSRADGRSDATVLRADVELYAEFGPFLAYSGRAIGQYADQPLLNYEEFSVGNLTVGRGYDPGANSGDRALGFRSEVIARLPAVATLSAQLFGFTDIVFLDNNDVDAIETDRRLRSMGGGLRLILPTRALLEVSYAHPLDRALRLDERPPPDRVLVSLTTQLLNLFR